MLTQRPPGPERSAGLCVTARSTLEYPIRLKLARGYIAGLRLLQDSGHPDPAVGQAQIEFHALLHDALTGHEGKSLESLEPVLSARYTRSKQNMTGVYLSFPEHGDDGTVSYHPSGPMKEFSIEMQIPTAFVIAALKRNSQPEDASYLEENSADPVPIPPERLRDITYSFAHRLSQRRDRGQVANWLLAEQILIQASASRTFPLP